MSPTVHLYLGLPLLLLALAPARPGFRARVALALAAAVAGGSVYRLAAAHAAGSRLRLPMSWAPDAGAAWHAAPLGGPPCAVGSGVLTPPNRAAAELCCQCQPPTRR